MKKNLSSLMILSMVTGCANQPIVQPDASRTTASFEGRSRPNWGGRYDGPPPEFKRDQWERKPSAFMYCDKYKNDSGRHVLACGAGVEEAMTMAQRFAGSHGREDGYLRGYAWGMNQSVNFWMNNQDEMLKGEADIGRLDSYFGRAVSEGQSSGKPEGESLGTSEAKNRFYKAIDTKVMPSPIFTLPRASFSPTQDAYSKYVGKIPTADEILRRERFGRMGFYDRFDRSYGGPDFHERNSRDMWSRDGVYNMNHNQWIQGEAAFKTWLNIPTPGKQRYLALNNSVSYTEQEDYGRVPAQASPGNRSTRPGGNGSGAQPAEPSASAPAARPSAPQPSAPSASAPAARPSAPLPSAPSASAPAAQPSAPSASAPATQPSAPAPSASAPETPPVPVVDYQAIFRDAFIQAYNAFAPAEYSRNYHMTLDDGQKDGEITGAEVGIEIARTKGLARAFNTKFSQVSYGNYVSSFNSGYTNSFNSTYEYFKTHSVLSLNFLEIVGADDDGIVQPAEPFSANFKITNAGGVAADLKYTVSGDIEDAQTFTDLVAPLSTKKIESPTIGSVLSTLDDGSNATFVLDVNGMQERLVKDIKRALEIREIKSNFTPVDGTGMYNVTIENIATTPVNGNISLELRINGNLTKSVIASAMQPGEKKSYALDFSSLDPLSWINGAYNVELLLKYNNVTFARKPFQLSVADTVDSLASYYTRLINEKGFVPAGKTLDNRLAEVKGLILRNNTAEVTSNIDASGNVYKTNPALTVPGKLIIAKDSYTNSQRAVAEFTSIADAMSSEAGRFKSFLFFHPKRDAYKELLGKLGGKTYK